MVEHVEEEETPKQRINRELIELLNELRVALPGVQVLFAFLLAIPFANGWKHTTQLQHRVLFAALLSAMLATVLLMAPSSYHRLLFRHHDKDRLVRHANRLAIMGLVCLGAALALSLFLVSDYIFGSVVAGLAAGGVAVLIAVLWFGMPLWIRLRDPETDP